MALDSGDIITYDGTKWVNQNYVAGPLGIGVSSPAAILHVLGTSTQLRLAYDSSHYATIAVSATGSLTLATVGTGGLADTTLNAERNLNLGTGSVDNIFIGRTDVSFVTTAVRGMFKVTTTGGTEGFYQDTNGRLFLRAPASAPSDGDIDASQISFWLDEGSDLLTFRVRYSDDSYATGSVSLTPD